MSRYIEFISIYSYTEFLSIYLYIVKLMQYDPDNNFWTNLGTTTPQKSYYSDSQELVVADTSIVSEKTDQKLSWPLYIDCQ